MKWSRASPQANTTTCGHTLTIPKHNTSTERGPSTNHAHDMNTPDLEKKTLPLPPTPPPHSVRPPGLAYGWRHSHVLSLTAVELH